MTTAVQNSTNYLPASNELPSHVTGAKNDSQVDIPVSPGSGFPSDNSGKEVLVRVARAIDSLGGGAGVLESNKLPSHHHHYKPEEVRPGTDDHHPSEFSPTEGVGWFTK